MIKPQVSVRLREAQSQPIHSLQVAFFRVPDVASQTRKRGKGEKSPASSKQQGWKVLLMSETIRNAQPKMLN